MLAIQSQRHKRIREKLDDLGVVNYYPMRTIWRKQRTGPRKRDERPLIPSYLFVTCDLNTRSARSILSIDGIHNFLGIQGEPSLCDADELERIRACEAAGDYDETLKRIAILLVGQTVPINVGPFDGHAGTITAIDGSSVTLAVSMFGKTHPIKINIDNLGSVL